IAADTYQTLEAPARSVSMWNFAIANCDLPASFVNAVVDVVMSDNERMVNIHRAARSTVPENWDKNGVLMWHPGAAQWFEENAGADIPDDMIHGG
ncbi:MAG: TAXI family TRAP transporter solute-binding subunit, partial [Paracoccaceae bacterium]|nr:TAXI family TRAP transporter solute-binding subunit [Paracoccaceae bacterium]